MHWLFMIGAIGFEVAGTTCMKLAEGFTRPLPSVLIFVFYAISFTLLTLALKRLDVSVVYPLWSGVGTVAIAVIGVAWFGESLSWLKVASIALIILGVVGLSIGRAESGG
ncbi:DMT family transporter [Novispirillum sp. DQ9]|uniref:DMT family transporter n=1 Tax=Novispirillum sp. DQ9 TaxID=3398612 RepID=UPI003C7BA42C